MFYKGYLLLLLIYELLPEPLNLATLWTAIYISYTHGEINLPKICCWLPTDSTT